MPYADGKTEPMVGDIVECVDAPGYPSVLKFQERYRITEICSAEGWVAVAEDRIQDHPGWSPCRFKLICRAAPTQETDQC